MDDISDEDNDDIVGNAVDMIDMMEEDENKKKEVAYCVHLKTVLIKFKIL